MTNTLIVHPSETKTWFRFLPQFFMKVKPSYIIGACIVLLAVAMLFLPHSAAKGKDFDPGAVAIAELIQQRADEYNELLEKRKPHLDIIEKEQKIVADLEDTMQKKSEGAAGLDHTLCKEFGVKYVRADKDTFAHLEEGCSFQ